MDARIKSGHDRREGQCENAEWVKNIAYGDFLFAFPRSFAYTGCVVIAHAEPVEVWGLEPCGSLVLPSQSRVWLGTVAARRTRRAPGAAYSRSNVAEQHPCFYGRPTILSAEVGKVRDERKRSSPAAAPPVQLGLAF